MTTDPSIPKQPLINDKLVDDLVAIPESKTFETKRVVGSKLTRALETAVAFANTNGGWLVLGLEDEDKAKGRDRSFDAVEELALNRRRTRRQAGVKQVQVVTLAIEEVAKERHLLS